MMPPKVSIVIPVYNVERWLDACLSSVLAQTYRHIEVVCVNDGSTDGSLARLNAWRQIDPRVQVVTTANGGLSAARNEGMRHITGDWVCFVDSDDTVEPVYVERLLAAALALDVTVVASAITIVDGRARTYNTAIHGITRLPPEGKLKRIRSDNPALFRFFPSAWNKIYRRDVLDGLAYPHGGYYEDHDVFLDVLDRVSHIGYVSDALYNYRAGRPGQITGDGGRKILDVFRVIDRIRRRHARLSALRPSSRLNRESARYIYRQLWERLIIAGPEAREALRARALADCTAEIAGADRVRDAGIPWFIKDYFDGVLTLSVMLCVPRSADPGRVRATVAALTGQALPSLEVIVVTDLPPAAVEKLGLPPGVRVLRTPFPTRLVAWARFRRVARGRFLTIRKLGKLPDRWHFYTRLQPVRPAPPGAAVLLTARRRKRDRDLGGPGRGGQGRG